ALALARRSTDLDTAPAYNDGDTERACGKLLAAFPGRRDRVFLTTKISGFSEQAERMYADIFKELPSEKQEAVRKRARELREARAVDKPGYYLTYFPGQPNQFEDSYLRAAMMRDYAHRVEGSPALRRYMADSLDGSLRRVGTDHFDIVMCPHGANTPDE